MAALVITCSPPHACKGEQQKQVSGRGCPRVRGAARTQSTSKGEEREEPQVINDRRAGWENLEGDNEGSHV
ncbi:hypothetical protein NDU88_005033 [Pleurodeles waltl]|uniref:Uncharacterized protein n=1 Tax=Pleurodeles waltl TaxID=8319 RepID=A0AAV7TSW9_PLEWA|nr:hypothetical protein NDU88_005033 [Pleurodeles waltl]